MRFAKSMVLEKVRNVTDRCVRSFTNVTCFVNKIINLFRNRLAHDTKNFAFARSLEINQPWLHWIARNVNLLSKLKRIMHGHVHRTGFAQYV